MPNNKDKQGSGIRLSMGFLDRSRAGVPTSTEDEDIDEFIGAMSRADSLCCRINREDDPVVLDCVIYGQRAENLAQYLAKGTRVTVQGRLRWDSWTDRETGKKRSKVDVVVNDLLFMSRSESGASPSGPNYGPMPAPPQNVVQAPPQVQQAVNDTFSSATPFNRQYPGGNFPQQDGQIPEVWSEDIPFD